MDNPNKISTLIYSALFILLYASGYVGAKLGFPYAKPLIFLSWRFGLSIFLLGLFAIFTKAKWPNTLIEYIHISVSGIFLVCLFSIGTWTSMDMGVPPAVSALIIALQPLIVSVVSYCILKKEISVKQWIGLTFGLLGVILVVWEQASFSSKYLVGILMSILGLIGLSVGNLYQKSFCTSMNIFSGGVIQSFVSGVICLTLAIFFEPMKINWTGQFVFSLFWMSVMVSLGAISFLYILISRGESHKVASLFYLIPGITAIIAYFVFNSKLDALQIIGMIVAMLGVALVNLKFNFSALSKDYKKIEENL